MQEGLLIEGTHTERKGNAPTGLNFQHSRLLRSLLRFKFTANGKRQTQVENFRE